MLTKPRTPAKGSQTSMYSSTRRRRVSPLMVIGISVPVLLALIGVGFLVVLPKFQSHAAAAVNPNCTLIVPANPLSAQGLATPYQLVALDAAQNGPCNESNANQSAFVQGTIYDPATGAFSVYSPLIIDQGTQPAATPVVPTLPANAVVGLWLGFNGTNLTLQGAQGGNTLAQGQCTNGLNGSIFGQFSFCNAPNFFSSVNQGIANGLVKVPALGIGKDGKTCPTTRDFSVIDQDQSDNVQTQYLANGTQIAQFTAANQKLFPNATTVANPSDNALLTHFIDAALGCTPWTATDLANPGTQVSSMALDEIMANADQKAPIALVPLTDPMTLVNNAQSQDKTIAYRKGVDQNPGGILPTDPVTYCQNFVNTGLPRIKGDMGITINATSPVPAMANSLFTFLAMRAQMSYTNLNCNVLLNAPTNPVTLTMDGNGVVTAATITLPGTATGGVTQAATGTAKITLNANAGTANVASNVTYANNPNKQINVNVTTNSCTGQALVTQPENTDGNGMNNANIVVQNLQGVAAVPNNWFVTVTDPAQNNAVVGCGSVTATGTTGTATLGTVATTTPVAPAAGTTPAAPAATTPAATVTPAVGTNQTPANNAPHKKGKHLKK